MNRYILEEFHSNPAFMRQAYARASRERSLAVYAAFAWLGERLTWLGKRLISAFHFRPSRWIERLG